MLKPGKTVKKYLAAGTIVTGLALAAPFIPEASASTEITMNTHQILSVGDRGQAVTKLQTRLHTLDYYNFTIDGIYGPITAGAVTSYQKEHGLIVDGIAGPQTLGSLFDSNARASRESSEAPSEMLSVGDRGSAVVNLQKKLHSLGYYDYAIDGIFGPITAGAVRSFQADHGLAVDGIAGPNTYAALYGGEEPVVAAEETNLVSEIIEDAKALIGTPYEWGGESPSGFDCSGFINYVFEKNGIHLPRTTAAIWDAATPAGSPEPGDLVFFETYKEGPSHVGIYIGNGKFIQCGTSTGVTISHMDNAYWGPRYLGAKTVL